MTLASPGFFLARLAATRAALRARGLDALLVLSLPNIAYLTGFAASAGALFLTHDRCRLIGDGRYAEELSARARACEFLDVLQIGPGESYDERVASELLSARGVAIGCEAAHLSVQRHQDLLRRLEKEGWRDPSLTATAGLIESQRACKDAWEVQRLRDGATRLSAVAKCILPNILAGRTELDVALEIAARLGAAGFERPAFETIVAAGPNSARAHARASARRIEDGDTVVVDFGGVLDGYCTDMTRTLTVGRRQPQIRDHIAAVMAAQAAAFAAIRPNVAPAVTAGEIDQAARSSLTDAGLAAAFTHGTGHGLGLEIHELPRLAPAALGRPDTPLAAGMVITLEPGVYFAGRHGVRIEDDVLVTSDGAEWLTDVPCIQE